jgi:hypothetical protein
MPTPTAAVRYITPTIVVVLIAGVFVGALVAPAHGHPARKDQDDPRAVALLYRAVEAPDRLAYTGTQYVSTWSVLDRAHSTSAIVQVRHAAGSTTLVAGHGAEPVLLPAQAGSWLAGDGGPIGLLVKTYHVQLLGQGRVAGRSADIVGALRPDGTLAARLWLDAEHALPLRREVYDEAERTMSASAFVDIEVAPALSRFVSVSRAQSDALAGSAFKIATLSHADLDGLRADGWHCPPELDGDLTLYQAARLGEAVQLSYSDGVATVSVFEQPGHLDPEAMDGFEVTERGDGIVYASPGPPSRLMWATGDGRVITVVADGSLETVESVIDAYPPGEANESSGLLHRIGRGAKRLVSWLNPFD